MLSHWDTRERGGELSSFMNTFSNTGNIPTLHQPTVTTVTHTHWLPTVADPHHLPQVWIYSCWLYSYYVLRDIAGQKTANAPENAYIRLVGSYCYIIHVFLSGSTVAWYMPWSVKWKYTQYQMLCSSHWQLANLLCVGTLCTAKCVCVSPIQWHGISA